MQFLHIVVLIAGIAVPAFSQQQVRPRLRQPDAPPTVRPRANAPLQDAILGFYISQFQQVAQVSDEVFARIMPHLREFVQERFEISARRTRALNQLRQTVNRNGSDEDLKRMIRELDQADADGQVNQERFLTNVDPLLNTQQQAKVRVFQATSDQRIRQMLDRIQNAGQNLQQAAPRPRD
jgi:hypothetical protein